MIIYSRLLKTYYGQVLGLMSKLEDVLLEPVGLTARKIKLLCQSFTTHSLDNAFEDAGVSSIT